MARHSSHHPDRISRPARLPTTRSFVDVKSVTDENGSKTEIRFEQVRRLSRPEDLYSRARRCHARGQHRLHRPQRRPLLRRPRRVLLERNRQRLAGAHRARRRRSSRFPQTLPADCAPRRSPESTDRPRARRLPTSKAPTSCSKPPTRCRCAGGMTIDIYIPKGVLKEPGSLTKLFWFLGSNPIVFLPLLTFARDVWRVAHGRERSRSRPVGGADVRTAQRINSSRGRHADRRLHRSSRHHFDHRRSCRTGLRQDRGKSRNSPGFQEEGLPIPPAEAA